MSLPNDIARCIGHAPDAPESICARRETCLRFTEPATSPWAGYLHPQVPGPCIHHIRPTCPQPGHGKKFMHGDTLLCMECGGLVPPGDPQEKRP